ncbi:MAG TPA: anthranilate phosphoribosyltransferase [candidate division Zixibacteria bacterium]|nr:anthranilate phosphoribosyltransferase [candidate division Zixibacteria bacterium]
MIQEAISKLVVKENLAVSEAQAVMSEIMSGTATPLQIAAYLTALAIKGETKEEILGSALVMREKSTKVPHHQEKILDCCGTGGDDAFTFNVSTLVAFVVAAAGIPVAKHGNRSVSSKCGSADLLSEAGVKLELSAEQVARCIDEIEIGFIFAPLFHPAMKQVAPVRKELGFRTIFNLLGPLTNPANTTCQIIGVFDEKLTEPLSEVAFNLGIRRNFVIHNLSKIDELATCESNKISTFNNGKSETFYIEAQELGFAKIQKSQLRGGNSPENLRIALAVLNGEDGAKRDVVILNSALALVVSENVNDIKEGIKLAQELLDSKKALKKFQQFIEFTQKC